MSMMEQKAKRISGVVAYCHVSAEQAFRRDRRGLTLIAKVAS